jgi:protein-arginine kinase activator protein McsA
MDNNDKYKNLIILFELFNNRPHHLAKYLIENSALDENFMKNIEKSKKLNDISNLENTNHSHILENFKSIREIDDFYDSIIENSERDINRITIDLNRRLKDLLEFENYEEAAKLRDYMRRKNIKKI